MRWTPEFGPVVKLCDYSGYSLGNPQKKDQTLMKAKRKRHDAQFKARVALEALTGIKTVQQIAKEFDLHPVQVSDWKKKLNTLASSVFESGKKAASEDFSVERTELHSKIGELTVKLDFVVKKSKQLGVWSGLPNSSNLNTPN
jgi:transposase